MKIFKPRVQIADLNADIILLTTTKEGLTTQLTAANEQLLATGLAKAALETKVSELEAELATLKKVGAPEDPPTPTP